MVLSNPFPGHTTLTTFADLRRDLEGLVARNSAGVMRAGVFPDHLSPLVTGRSDMKVNIGDFRAVQNRGGAVLLANVGTDTSVTLPAAPGTNKRIDLIYVTMRSTALADTASTPVFGFVQGTASATPVAPSLPANLSTAIPLATVEIPAGATTTLSAGVVITQVYPYTALAGGTVVVRNNVELAAWTPADGARAYCVADGSEYVRASAGWVFDAVAQRPVTLAVTGIASASMTARWSAAGGLVSVSAQLAATKLWSQFTGPVTISVPHGELPGNLGTVYGTAMIVDLSSGAIYQGVVRRNAATSVTVDWVESSATPARLRALPGAVGIPLTNGVTLVTEFSYYPV